MSKKYSILFIFIMMLVIFSFSNKNTNESNSTSTKLIYNISNKAIDISNKLNITNIDSNLYAHKLSIKLNKPVRKLAHFSLYFVLSIIVIYVLKIYKVNNVYLYTFMICFIYSISDEVHQLFVSGRTGSIIDVIIDSMGCILGIILYRYITGDKYEKA